VIFYFWKKEIIFSSAWRRTWTKTKGRRRTTEKIRRRTTFTWNRKERKRYNYRNDERYENNLYLIYRRWTINWTTRRRRKKGRRWLETIHPRNTQCCSIRCLYITGYILAFHGKHLELFSFFEILSFRMIMMLDIYIIVNFPIKMIVFNIILNDKMR